MYGACAVVSAFFFLRWARLRSATGFHDLNRAVLTALVLFFGSFFASDVVAPARLGLPLHRCLWCLVGEAPETVVGLILLAAPFLAASWRIFVLALGPGTGPSTERIFRALDRIALLGLLGGLAFFVSQRLAA